MLWRVDPASTVPLFEQIAGQARGAMLRGDVKVGDRLPTAREMAEHLEVNMHTVLRAYAVLRDEGLLQVRPGRGVVVVGSVTGVRLRDLASQLVAEARRQGLSRAQVQRLVHETM